MENDDMNLLNFKEYFYGPILEGIKTSTIRKHSDLKEGEIVESNFYRSPEPLYLKITKVNRIRFDEIDLDMATKEGYRHPVLLKKELMGIYPNAVDSELFYQLEFELIK